VISAYDPLVQTMVAGPLAIELSRLSDYIVFTLTHSYDTFLFS
jgi:hypothetical protein